MTMFGRLTSTDCSWDRLATGEAIDAAYNANSKRIRNSFRMTHRTLKRSA